MPGSSEALQQLASQESPYTIDVSEQPAVAAMPREPGTQIETVEFTSGAAMNVHPQEVRISEAAATTIEDAMADWSAAYPGEPTLAQEEYGVPAVIARADCVISPDGQLHVYEIDDHPVGSGIMQQLIPESAPAFGALKDHIEKGRPLVTELMYDERPYAHDDDLWLPQITAATPEDYAIIARGRRSSPGFDEFMERHERHSILTGRIRDSKRPLVDMDIATDFQHVDEFAAAVAELPEDQRKNYVVKREHSSRGETVGVLLNSKKHRGGETMSRIKGKMEDDNVVVQAFKEPPRMSNIGLTFTDADHAFGLDMIDRSSREYRDSERNAIFAPGTEGENYSILRIFGVLDPDSGRHAVVAGMAASRPNVLVHGAEDATTARVTVGSTK